MSATNTPHPLTSAGGTLARGCVMRPRGTRQPLRRSLEQGTVYIVERMKRGLQFPGERGVGRREGEGGVGRGEGERDRALRLVL